MISWLGRVVAAAARHPFVVLLVSLGLTAAALVYAAGHFAMTADTAELISTRHEWRQRELAYERAFPSLQRLTIVVIDGATPELAVDAASRLSAALAREPGLFQVVRRPDGGPFFDRNGLLFLSLPQVQATVEGLSRSQALLASLAADPSLRGVLATVSRLLQGVQHSQAKLDEFQPLLLALADTFDKAAAGQPAFFSWQDVMGASDVRRQTRRVLIVQPVMDFTALQPGEAASKAIRAAARSLALDDAHGVRIRLTGPVPLADEEFASLAQDWHLVAAAMVIALLGILWWAVHSGRVVAAILLATFMGLIMTAALGLLVTGRFNLISVAFIPLFVGLGIDFSIQFSVRFLAERHFHLCPGHPGLREALVAAGRGVGLPLAVAAAAIGAGFFAFLPTDYIGIAELGLIAGLGMAVAFALAVTLLPALLALLRPRPGRMEVGFARLAPVESFLGRHRRGVLSLGLAVAVAAAAVLPFVRFDFNPLHLKSPKVESMATLADLAADPDWTPNTINVIVPSAAAAGPIAHRLGELPEVSRVLSLASFVPDGQVEKLALIRAAAERLGPALGMPAAPSPSNEAPSDEEIRQALASTAALLRQVAPASSPAASQAALRLAGALDRLGEASPDIRAVAATAVVLPLGVMLERVRALLQAGPVTVEQLPADVVADWIARDGRARIQAFPRRELETDDGLWRFARAVQAVAPDATGVPISIRAAGDSVVAAFLQAGAWSFAAIVVILAAALRRVRDVVLTMVPVLLSGLLTFATSAVLDLPLNFANIIALPLLFGVGVAFNIYFVMAWRAGETAPLQSSLMRAVVFSALTTATAFGALWLSSHPGTASMGRLLMISLGWELLVTLLFRPALLAVPPQAPDAAR